MKAGALGSAAGLDGRPRPRAPPGPSTPGPAEPTPARRRPPPPARRGVGEAGGPRAAEAANNPRRHYEAPWGPSSLSKREGATKCARFLFLYSHPPFPSYLRDQVPLFFRSLYPSRKTGSGRSSQSPDSVRPLDTCQPPLQPPCISTKRPSHQRILGRMSSRSVYRRPRVSLAQPSVPSNVNGDPGE